MRFNYVATDFFDAFGARVIAGRALRDSDGTGSTQAIVVNRAFVINCLAAPMPSAAGCDTSRREARTGDRGRHHRNTRSSAW